MSQFHFNDPDTIAALTTALEAAGVDGLEITGPGHSLRIVLRKTAGRNATTAGQTRPPNRTVTAPMAGIFLRELPACDGSVSAPRQRPDGVLGFLRVGPVLLPLATDPSVSVLSYLADEGAIVSYGDPLLEVEAV